MTNSGPSVAQEGRGPDPLIGREAHRLFLVVIDETEELGAAIRYACNRARRTGGRVALLCAYDVEKDLETFAFVGNTIGEDARTAAEQIAARHAASIQAATGRAPDVYVRKGNRREELFKLMTEKPEVSILVLAAAPGSRPGPLIEAVTGKFAGKIGRPVTIVPGDLAASEIDRLTSG
jgi:hypothetical protein